MGIIRRRLVVPALIVIAIPAVFTALPYGRTLGRSCGSCAGKGWTAPPDAVCLACQSERCPVCEGSGGRITVTDFVTRYGRTVVRGRAAVIDFYFAFPRETIALVGFLVIGVILWRCREVACRVCRRTGRLRLEVVPPGATAFTVSVGCPFCGCTGTVPASAA